MRSEPPFLLLGPVSERQRRMMALVAEVSQPGDVFHPLAESGRLTARVGREVVQFLAHKPADPRSKSRSVVIDMAGSRPADQMAMLRYFEEVLSGRIILLAHSKSDVLGTILSRCRVEECLPESYNQAVQDELQRIGPGRRAEAAQSAMAVLHGRDAVTAPTEESEALALVMAKYLDNRALLPLLESLWSLDESLLPRVLASFRTRLIRATKDVLMATYDASDDDYAGSIVLAAQRMIRKQRTEFEY